MYVNSFLLEILFFPGKLFEDPRLLAQNQVTEAKKTWPRSRETAEKGIGQWSPGTGKVPGLTEL